MTVSSGQERHFYQRSKGILYDTRNSQSFLQSLAKINVKHEVNELCGFIEGIGILMEVSILLSILGGPGRRVD